MGALQAVLEISLGKVLKGWVVLNNCVLFRCWQVGLTKPPFLVRAGSEGEVGF